MTAVSPYVVPLETVIDVEDEETWEQVSLFSSSINNNEEEECKKKVEYQAVPKHKMTIAEGLHALLVSMKLFGLYFSHRGSADGGDRKWSAYRIYAFTVVMLLWINVVRMFSIFTPDDKFGIFLMSKLINVIWTLQCAVSQTAFYAASLSGRLAVVFRQPLDDSCARHARKLTALYSVAGWSIIILGSSAMAYGLFFTDGFTDFYITPLQNHIVTSHNMARAASIVVYLLSFYLLSSYVFSQTITLVLAMIFTHQYSKVTQTLTSRLENSKQRQVSDEDIETFRQKHQLRITMGHTESPRSPNHLGHHVPPWVTKMSRQSDRNIKRYPLAKVRRQTVARHCRGGR